MALYRLRSAAFIGGVLREAGETVEWNGSPAPHMEKLKDQAPSGTDKATPQPPTKDE